MRHVLRSRITLALGILIVAAVATFALVGTLATRSDGGPSTEASSHTGRSATSTVAGKALAPAPEPAFAPAQATASAASAGDTVPALDMTRFLVRTGQLDLLVNKGQAPQVANHISTVAEALGGYVLASNVSTGLQGERPYAEVAVRIPARSYDQAIRQFSALGKVRSLTTSAQDVTGSYVDLQARLSHYRAVESRLLTFLAHSASIQQALSIQQRIDATQLTVERLAAQLKALRETVIYGTLTVSVTERSSKPLPGPQTKPASFLGALTHSAKLIWTGAQATFVALGAALPFLGVCLALAYGVWLVYRRLKRAGRLHSTDAQQPMERPL